MENNSFDLNLLDMKSIDETLEFYTGNLKDKVEEHKKIFGYSPDNKESIISYAINGVTEDMKGVNSFISIFKELVAENLVTKESMTFYIELITNEKLRNKIRFISDGSYYKYRIWANCLNCEKLELSIDYKKDKTLFDMVEECQYILLQIPYFLKKDLESAKQWIEYEIENNKLDYEFYY